MISEFRKKILPSIKKTFIVIGFLIILVAVGFFWNSISKKISLDKAQNLASIIGISPAMQIVRSVGPSNTTALTTGTSNDLTISGSVATFSVALADNIGVGDALQYDSDDNGSIDAIAFVHSRTNSTTYIIRDAAGASVSDMGTVDNNWSLFRAYTSLASAETGTENTGIDDTVENFDTFSGGKDIVASDEQWNIACYGDSADGTKVVIDGWTTGAENYIRIFTPTDATDVGVSQRHDGKWNTGKYRIEYTTAGGYQSVIRVSDDYVRIDGLQILISGVDDYSVGIDSVSVTATNNDIRISNNIIKADTTGKAWGIHNYDTSPRFEIWNNIIFNFDGVFDYGISLETTVSDVYNNTFYNCNRGISSGASVTLKNNLAQACINDGFFGSFHASSDYNISNVYNDTTGGSNDKHTQTVSFVSTTAGSEDLHLQSGDTVAKDAGTDLSADSNLAFSDDIDGETRTGTWDIGADEYVSSDSTAPTLAQVTAVPSPDNDTTPSYTFSSDEAGTITYGGSCSATVTTAILGNTTVDFNTLSDGTYSDCTITVTDTATNASDALGINTFIIDSTAPSTTSDLSISSCATSTCDMLWTAPGDSGGVGTATTYDLRYSTTAITDDTDYDNATEASGEPSPSAVGADETFTVTGLSNNTGYYFALKTDDEIPNTSALSNIVSSTTTDPTAPVIAEVTAITTPSNDTTPSYVFSSDKIGDLSYGGSCDSTATTTTVGNNTVTFTTLTAATYSDCTITATNAISGEGSTLNIPTFVIQNYTTNSGETDYSSESSLPIVLSTGTGTSTLPANSSSVVLTTSQYLSLGDGTEAGLNSETVSSVTIEDAFETVRGTALSTDTKKVTLSKGTGSSGSDITIKTSTLEIVLEDETTIYAPKDWDGYLAPPVVSSSVKSGYTNNVSISVGSGGSTLLLDKVAKIVLTGTAGDPYYSADGNTWTAISACADATSSSAGSLAFPNSCYIESGGETIIWTYHFTQFGNFTQVVSSVSSGGGGGPIFGTFDKPKAYSGGFAVKINSEDGTINLYGGPNIQYFAISETPDFRTAIKQNYLPEDKNYQTIDYLFPEGIQKQQIYAKFFTLYWNASDVVEDSILFDTIGPVISGISVEDISSHSARMNFSTNENTLTTLHFGVTDQYGFVKTIEDYQTDYSILLSNLNNTTPYHYQIETSDEFENVSYSQDRVFTTKGNEDGTPPTKVDDLHTTNIYSDAIVLTWTATGDDERKGQAFAYDLRTTIGAIDGMSFENKGLEIEGEPVPKPTGQQEVFTITNLKPNVYYGIAIKAIDDNSNSSSISNVLVIKTLEEGNNLPVVQEEKQNEVQNESQDQLAQIQKQINMIKSELPALVRTFLNILRGF